MGQLRGHHIGYQQCVDNVRRNRQRERRREVLQALSRTFTIDGDILQKVEKFRYLGRPISHVDSDHLALLHNLKKARKRLALISRLLVREGASAFVGGKFYSAAILSVLLYGSESWVWTQPMLKAVVGFHNRAARRLAGRPPKRLQDGTFEYCPAMEALLATRLLPIQVYIARRWRKIRTYVERRPIFKLCEESKRATGGSPRTRFWWEQDFSDWEREEFCNAEDVDTRDPE